MSPLIINGSSEKELITAAIEGDRIAQKEIYAMYSGKMMAICSRYTRHRAEAEDIFQDAFVKVFIHLEDFKFIGSFEGWIRRIMIYTALKNAEKKSNANEDIGIEDTYENFSEPEIISELSEEEITKLINKLPEGYRKVFNLYVIDGYSHKEIAEMMQIGEATSRSQLLKARRMLQEKVTDLYKIAG